MAEHDIKNTQKDGRRRTRVTLRKGEAIALCRCWRSQNFPLCDGSHKNKADEKGPVIIRTDCSTDFLDQGD